MHLLKHDVLNQLNELQMYTITDQKALKTSDN